MVPLRVKYPFPQPPSPPPKQWPKLIATNHLTDCQTNRFFDYSLRFVERMAPSEFMRKRFKPLFAIPFNSANKWSLVVSIMGSL